MFIQGKFDIEVDESDFQTYLTRFGDRKVSDETAAENFIASLLLGQYRAGTAEAAGVTVTLIEK